MKLTRILIGIFILMLSALFVNAEFNSDENIQMGGNDVYNITNLNATNIYSSGSLITADTNWQLNFTAMENQSNFLGLNMTTLLNIFLKFTDLFGGDVSGLYSNLQLGTDVVNDGELNYSNVTLNDFTNDAGYVKNNSDVTFTTINSTTSWDNVSITESQVSDLQIYTVNNTGGWILNFTTLGSDDWTNATLTESQISDLRAYLTNGSDINVLDINASSVTIQETLVVLGNISGNGQNITLATIGSNTQFKTLQEIQNLFHSSGVFNENSSVDFIQLNGDNTFNVSGGSGTIRNSNNATDILLFFDWTASNNIAIALNEVIYVGIEYNAGSPQVVTKSTYTWDSQTEFPLGSIVRDISGVHEQREDHAVGDHATNMINRIYGTSPFARDNRAGGLILGTSGLNITVSAGTIWEKLNVFPISAIDTSVSDTFDRYYRNGTGGWFVELNITVWNNTHYDDGTGTLNLLANNKWSVEWVYLEIDGEIVTQYGREQFNTEGEAEASSPPTTAPDRLVIHSVLIGRIIWQEGATSATATQSVYTQTFSAAGVIDHGNLVGLGDDDHAQYLLAAGTRALTDNWFAQFGIYSNNWTNVTINENQITDLQIYTVNNTGGWILNFSNIYSENWGNVTITKSQITGFSVEDTDMASESFGDWTCTGSEDGCTLNTDSVQDNEIDFSAVTLADFINDALFVANFTDANLLNLNITDLNVTGGNVSSVGNLSFVNDRDHQIFDNATCIIIKGDTSELIIC